MRTQSVNTRAYRFSVRNFQGVSGIVLPRFRPSGCETIPSRNPFTLHACPVVHDAAKEQRLPADLLRICETSLTHEGNDSALRIVFQPVI